MLGTNARDTKAKVMLGAALATLAGAALVNVVPSAAQVPPIASEALTARAVFPDDIDLKLKIKQPGGATTVVNVEDPSRTAVVRFTVQPGAQFPWHSHAGPVVVNIVSGALTYVDAETCAEETYRAGEAFVDPGQGHAHSATNEGSVPTVLMATFFDAPPAPESLLIPTEPASC
jgi:quercetin dioxygenase-like cupin family protein